MPRFGFNLQLEEYSVDLAVKTAKTLEDLGLNAIFVNDHYMKPNGNNLPDAFLTLTAIAAQTRSLKIGTAVTPIPFRSAPQTAKIVSTLDNISRGRFLFGVGAGWYEAEFAAYGSQFPCARERVSKTIEGIRVMKRLWTEEEVTFEGKYYQIKASVLLPKSVQTPYPPILVGSRSPRMCRFAAREGDGWIPFHLPPEDYLDIKDNMAIEAEKCGRRADDLMFAYCTRILTGAHREQVLKSASRDEISAIEAKYLVGPPEECIDQLGRYADIGVDLILLRLQLPTKTPFTDESHDQQIEFISDEIISRL